MKRFLLTSGLLLLVLGLGLSWAGVRMGGETMATVRLFGRSWNVYAPTAAWDVADIRDAVAVGGTSHATPAVELPEDVTDLSGDNTPFSSINVNVDLGTVSIVAGDDYLVDIRTWGKGYEVDHWYSGDTLYIESNDSDTFLPTNCGSEVTVYVPADVWLESLYVDLDLGDLTLAGLSLEYAEIDLDLGSLTGEALTVTTTFQVDADLGEVNLFGDLGECVDISADLGSVQLGLSKPASDYCWELEADLGSITVDGRNQHVNDENEVTGGYGNKMIEVDASLGSITVDFDQDFAGERPAAVAQEGTAPVMEDRGDFSPAVQESAGTE